MHSCCKAVVEHRLVNCSNIKVLLGKQLHSVSNEQNQKKRLNINHVSNVAHRTDNFWKISVVGGRSCTEVSSNKISGS